MSDKRMSEKRKCAGYVYFGDQGIQRCEECNGCLCCDLDNVDHSEARYRCWTDSHGACALKGNQHHPNHVCIRDAWPTK